MNCATLLLLALAPLAAYDGVAKPSIAEVQHSTDQLAAADFRDRWYAAYTLGTFGPDAAPAVPTLHKVLEKKSEHEYVRGMAAWRSGASDLPLSLRFRC